MKNSRHARILEIIADNVIETQDDLMEKLRESGYPVTQATVSRDIKQLGLIKTATKSGNYQYTVAKTEGSSNLKVIMHETIVSVQSAGNIVVVKTYAGMANAAAAVIDSAAGDQIVGSIAGDDTVFIVVPDEKSAADVVEHIKDNL